MLRKSREKNPHAFFIFFFIFTVRQTERREMKTKRAFCPGDLSLLEAVNDPGLVQIVRRHLQLHPIAQSQPDESLPHFPRNMRQDAVFIRELYSKHGAGEDCDDSSFGFDGAFSHLGGVRMRMDERAKFRGGNKLLQKIR